MTPAKIAALRRNTNAARRQKYEADNPSDPAAFSRSKPFIAPVGERARRRDDPKLPRLSADFTSFRPTAFIPDSGELNG